MRWWRFKKRLLEISGIHGKKHYIFEVDMEYPAELHDRDDDYPLAPETMTIEADITGKKQHELHAKYFGAACPFSRKLLCSFLPKRKYVVHGHLLQFILIAR